MEIGLGYAGKLRKKDGERRRWRRAGQAALLLLEAFLLLFFLWKLLELSDLSGIRLLQPEAGAADPGVVQAAYRQGKNKENAVKEASLTLPVSPEEVITRFHPGTILVALDAGHGGVDDGCRFDGVAEKEINLQIALLTKQKLEKLGYQVLMTRQDDGWLSKERRVKLANMAGANIYVSIHQNSFEKETVKGIETWYYAQDTSRDSERLARLLQQETAAAAGARERALRGDAELYVTGKTDMPACLIETGFLSNPEERALLTDPTYQERLAEGIANGIELYFHPKTMYLTFDDGPVAGNTERVLDILKERGIRAAFFVVGENVEKNPELARRIVSEGHTLGIHCYSHDYEKLYASAESYLADFDRAWKLVKEVTGVEAELFRFPGGSINAYNQEVYREIMEKMEERGFLYHDWNASLEDAVSQAEPEELITNARETALGRKRVVMLAHDAVYNTGICLDALLDSFPEYRFEPLTADVEPVRFAQ